MNTKDQDIKQIITDLPVTEEEKQAWLQRLDSEGATKQYLEDLAGLLDTLAGDLEQVGLAKLVEEHLKEDLERAMERYEKEMDKAQDQIGSAMGDMQKELDSLAADQVRSKIQ